MCTIQEWNQLIASPIGTQCKRDSRQSLNGTEAQNNIVVLTIAISIMRQGTENQRVRTLSSSIKTAIG